MEALKQTTKHTHFVPIIIFVLLAMGLLIVVVGKVGNDGSSDIRSRASKDTTLTAGDDAFSLEQDLRTLEKDATLEDEKQLQNLNY